PADLEYLTRYGDASVYFHGRPDAHVDQPRRANGSRRAGRTRDLMADRFNTFADLAKKKREGVHWRVTSCDRQSGTLVAAPHAGRAEAHTGKIATAIAGAAHSLYLFETLSPGLHVTSHRFDEPRAVAQACRHAHVVTIHGCDNKRS